MPSRHAFFPAAPVAPPGLLLSLREKFLIVEKRLPFLSPPVFPHFFDADYLQSKYLLLLQCKVAEIRDLFDRPPEEEAHRRSARNRSDTLEYLPNVVHRPWS